MAKAIQVENLSKQYRLGQIGTGSLVHDMNRWWHSVRGKENPYLKIGEANDRSTKGASEYVWSLRDVGFDIEQGDSVGIIGRNGAGKSTLLKILSRVTAPTTGSVKVKGRIASLLEVGTGFHPDLSGRDNIFLNGAILGMRKGEIAKKFDEIVDFAGVERYIDTPVKRYSSGMYVRLAFAVAAYLESEILIVDEVLAVGDAEFQKKCLGKMGDVSKSEGRTILFVSHNMSAVSQLCTKGILLKNGEVIYKGSGPLSIEKYLTSSSNLGSFCAKNDSNKPIQILNADIVDKQGTLNSSFGHDEEIGVVFTIKNISKETNLRCAIGVWDNMEKLITIDRFTIESSFDAKTFKCIIPRGLLVPNKFKVSISIYIPQQKVFDLIPDFLSFEVIDLGAKAIKLSENHEGLIFCDMSISSIDHNK